MDNVKDDMRSYPTENVEFDLINTNDKKVSGLSGIENSGNTCYFSSVLQCLIHTIPLRNYTLSNSFCDDINTENKLGTKGLLAREFKKTMTNAWDGTNSYICISGIKSILGSKCKRYKSREQQDAHELLIYMINCLHEDLNRVKKKENVTFIKGDGTDDEHVLKDTLEKIKKVDDSEIMEMFFGIIKTDIHCHECGQRFVFYEPSSVISLPMNSTENVCSLVNHVTFQGDRYTSTFYFTKDDEDFPVKSDGKCFIYAKNRLDKEKPKFSKDYNPSRNCCNTIYEVEKNKFYAQVYICSVPEDCLFSEDVLDGPYLVELESPKEELEKVYDKIRARFKYIWKLKNGETHEKYFLSFKLRRGFPFLKWNGFTPHKNCENISKQRILVFIDRYDPALNQNNFLKLRSDLGVVSITNLEKIIKKNEEPTEIDEYYCDKCKCHVKATRKYSFEKLPNVLIFHFERFSSGNKYEKNNTFVDFPEHYFYKNSRYVLYAIIDHQGTINYGHYTCYVRNGNCWYHFNDTQCCVVNPSKIFTVGAYIIFYQKNAS